MADFTAEDLRGSRFERVDLSGSEFRASDLTNTRFRGVEMNRVVMRGVELVDVDIHGEIVNLTINGVDVAPLVDAELDLRYPDRAKMRPTDPAGFREAWDVVERLWGAAIRRRGIPWTCRGTRCRTRRACPETATYDRLSTWCSSCAATGCPPCARFSTA